MKNKMKFLFGFLALALGFLFCFCLSISVSAEEVEETVEIVETDEEALKSFLYHLKDLKWDEFEAIIGWVIAYLVANFAAILGCIITIVLNKHKEYKTSKAYQEAFAKLSLENQQKIEEREKQYIQTLESLKAEILENQKENQQKLVDLSNDQTKEIAKACASITADLSK
jgi:hypothetical protein